MQQAGLHLVPANFYSSVPSIAETLGSFEYRDEAPYLDPRVFDAARLQQQLRELIPFAADFAPPEDGDEESCENYFWRNSQFAYSDAMSYYAMIRRLRPGKVVEIGSGFSSLVALEALRRNANGRLVCIEPYPRGFITRHAEAGALELRQSPAQAVSADEFNAVLEDGDILFIDSTHTVKTGSDCLHIYLRLLPRLRRKVTVHVHDVFLPFGVPQAWLLEHQIFWTEQYLLLAFLTDNPKVDVLFGSAYHAAYSRELLDAFMHGRYPAGGGSFWFGYDGTRA